MPPCSGSKARSAASPAPSTAIRAIAILEPYLGAMHAVAESTRNVSCSGATPRGATNCLNFGNPQRPAGYYQLDRAVSGLADACRALDVPMVGGNVSLYNETAAAPIKPNPTVGVVGVFDDVRQHATMKWQSGQLVYLIGESTPVLGGSEYLSVIHQEVTGQPPALDLSVERSVQHAVRSLVADGITTTAHDLSLGGLAVALAKMSVISGVGAKVDSTRILERSDRVDEAWFGESASQIIVTCDPASRDRLESRLVHDGVCLYIAR